MEHTENKKKFKPVGIQFIMDAKSNQLLEKSASESIRTKKAEARLRLADHLHRFPSITKVGLCEERRS
jgi:hypothetical protein